MMEGMVWAYTHEITSRFFFLFCNESEAKIIFLSSLSILSLIVGESMREGKCKRCRGVMGRLDPFVAFAC